MKILFLTPWYPSEDKPADGVFVKEHARAVQLFDEVTVVHLAGYDRHVKGLYACDERIDDGLRTVRLTYGRYPVPRMPSMNAVAAAVLGVRRLIRDGFEPDIVHAHTHLSGWGTVLIARLLRKPFVVTEHSSNFPQRVLPKTEIRLARAVFRSADIVLPVSDSLAKGIQSYGVDSKFRVVPNTVDTDMFHPGQCTGDAVQEKRLLFVGKLTDIKGVQYLLQAMRPLLDRRDDFSLDIVGDGPKRSEYEELASRLGIQDRVRFHGMMLKPEIAQIMRTSHAFVLPSLWENMPCVLIEALASGLPVVASEVGGIPEIMDDRCGILCGRGDVQALADAVNYMLDHHQEYVHAELAQIAREKYSYAVVGRMITDIYRELV